MRRSGSRRVEVVAAEIAVGLAGGEHVPVGDEHRVLDGAERAAVPEAGFEPLVLGLEVAVFGAGRGQRGFLERDPEELAALAGRPERRLPADWSLPGQRPGPGGEVPGGGEHAHVDADLGDHHLGGAGGDAGDRGGQRDGRLPGRAQLGLDRLGELGDLLVEEVQVREDRADDQRVMGLEAALRAPL